MPMTMEQVSERIHNFKTDGSEENLDSATHALGEYLYLHLTQYRLALHDEDTRSDFITWLYPKMPRIIQQYIPGKASFKTYLSWVIRLTFKTFCREYYGKEARQQVFLVEEQTRILSEMADRANRNEWNDIHYETTTTPKGKFPFIPEQEPDTKKRRQVAARKIVLLACKSGNALDDQIISTIAQTTGMTEAYLNSKLDCVRQRWVLSLDRMRVLQEKRFECYLRAQKSLMEMKQVDPDGSRYACLEHEYRYCTRRIEELKEQGRKLQCAPSNRFLAGVLGMCRGTVDSTLARVKIREYSDVS